MVRVGVSSERRVEQREPSRGESDPECTPERESRGDPKRTAKKVFEKGTNLRAPIVSCPVRSAWNGGLKSCGEPRRAAGNNSTSRVRCVIGDR